jgi:hypothetical protein
MVSPRSCFSQFLIAFGARWSFSARIWVSKQADGELVEWVIVIVEKVFFLIGEYFFGVIYMTLSPQVAGLDGP